MERKQPSSISQALLTRYICGEYSDDELAIILAWLQEDEANQRELDQLQDAWEQFDSVDPVYLERTDAAWARFEHRVGIEKPVRRLQPWMSMAAGFLALAVIGGLLWQSQRNVVPEMQAYTNQSLSPNELLLEDSSTLSLKPGSKIQFPEEFASNERKVILEEGQAYFEVTKNPEKAFVVDAGEVSVEVLGTSFEVNKDETEQQTTVSVSEGTVAVQHNTDKLILKAGEQAIYNQITKVLEAVKRPNMNALAWKTGKLTFRRTPMKRVAQLLEEIYAKPIVFENEALQTCPCTAKFRNKPLAKVLDIIETTLPGLEIVELEDKVLIKGKACQ